MSDEKCCGLPDVCLFYACPAAEDDSTERFERLAALFYAETGMMAPGKDVPAAAGEGPTFNERMARWDAWLEENER